MDGDLHPGGRGADLRRRAWLAGAVLTMPAAITAKRTEALATGPVSITVKSPVIGVPTMDVAREGAGVRHRRRLHNEEGVCRSRRWCDRPGPSSPEIGHAQSGPGAQAIEI